MMMLLAKRTLCQQAMNIINDEPEVYFANVVTFGVTVSRVLGQRGGGVEGITYSWYLALLTQVWLWFRFRKPNTPLTQFDVLAEGCLNSVPAALQPKPFRTGNTNERAECIAVLRACAKDTEHFSSEVRKNFLYLKGAVDASHQVWAGRGGGKERIFRRN